MWDVRNQVHAILEWSHFNTFTHGGKHEQHVIHWFYGIYSIPAYDYLCVVQDKMHLYRLRLVVNLLTNVANNAREKVMKACPMWRMRVVPLLLVAIYNKLKLAYKRQYKREKKTCIYIIMFSLIKHRKAWYDLSLVLLDNWQQILHLVNKMKLLHMIPVRKWILIDEEINDSEDK